MFRMYGRIVEILRYQSTSTDRREPITHYAPTQEEAAALGENVQPLPLEDDAWMDGLEVADVPDTMAEAIKIRDMGQTAYLALLKRQAQQARRQCGFDGPHCRPGAAADDAGAGGERGRR